MFKHLRDIALRLEAGQRVNLLGLGDSLTQGWMVEEGYYDRFVQRCRTHYSAADIHSVNLGVPGSTAGNATRRLTDVKSHHPDLVIVQFAINDCYSGVSVERFAENLATIVTGITSMGAQAVLVTSCPVQERYFNGMLEAFYAAIDNIGATLAQPVARLDTYWLANTELRSLPDQIAALYLDDGVHPSDAGHDLMAQGLMDYWLNATGSHPSE